MRAIFAGALRPLTWAAPFVVVMLATSCGGGDAGSDDPVDSGNTDGCPEGFVVGDQPLHGCVEVAPPGDCPAGTAPILGSSDCTPLGPPAACPSGFVADASGWGCADQTPATACEGATRESVHATTCVPVGDCNGAPPPSALLVDATFDAGQLDATHFQTIGAALATASSGATVWVAAGTYEENVSIKKPLTLAGVCAEKVIIAAPPSSSGPGIHISGIQDVTLRGLTVRGHTRAIDLGAAADVTIDSVVVDQAVAAGIFVDASRATVRATKVSGTRIGADGKWGWGIAAGGKSTVTVEDSTLVGGVDGVFAASSGTVVTVRDSVVARQAPTAATRSSGVDVVTGAKLVLERSVVRDVAGDGAGVADDGGRAEVNEGGLRGTRVQGSQARGHGVVAIAGGTVVLAKSSVSDMESVALDSQGSGSHLEVTDSVVRGPEESHAKVDTHLGVSSDRSGIGMQVIDKAAATLDGVAVLGAWGFSIYVQSSGSLKARHLFVDQTRDLTTPEIAGSISFAVGVAIDTASKAEITDSTVLHGRLAGLNVSAGAEVVGSGLLLRDVNAADPLGTGSGVSVGEGGRATLSRCAIVHTSGVGALVVRGGDASLVLSDATIHGVHAASTGFGDGAVGGPQTNMTFERVAFYDNEAIGLALAGGSARVIDSTFARNLIALHVQDGSFVAESDGDSALSPGELRISSRTAFAENGTKLGTGPLPLPEDPIE